MNKFVTTALAVAALGTVANAQPKESDWLELDREINSLASAVPATGAIGGWALLLRSAFIYSSDELAQIGGEDTSGFKILDARFSAWGEIENYGWRVSYNLFDGSAALEDAYAYWLCGEWFTATMGNFRANVFRSNTVWEENQLFIDRSHIGAAFDRFDTGLGARGDYQDFSWYINIMNGSNGKASGHFWNARLEYHWNGGAGDFEGSYGHGDDPQGSFGLVYGMDDTVSGDTGFFGLDANGTAGPIGWGAEVAMIDEDYTLGLDTGIHWSGAANGLSFANDDDSTPWTVFVSYLINQEFQAALRLLDFDNVFDESVITLALIYYQSGMAAKWNAEVFSISTDDPGADDTTGFQLSLNLGSSL